LSRLGSLKLTNLFEKSDDYVITGALHKIKDGANFIAFDCYGMILAISEEIHEKLFDASNYIAP